MKKIFFVAILFLFNSCNKDENENNETKYSVTIEQSDCGGTKSNYCITETEKDRIQNLIEEHLNDPCVWISITDISGNSYNGYYRSSGIDNDSICN